MSESTYEETCKTIENYKNISTTIRDATASSRDPETTGMDAIKLSKIVQCEISVRVDTVGGVAKKVIGEKINKKRCIKNKTLRSTTTNSIRRRVIPTAAILWLERILEIKAQKE